jgi:hypothetical protein
MIYKLWEAEDEQRPEDGSPTSTVVTNAEASCSPGPEPGGHS